MIFFVARTLITMIVILLTAHFIPGLRAGNVFELLLFGFLLAMINAIVRPILTILTLPVTLVTLGVFLLLLNGFTFWFASELAYGVYVSSIWGALLGGFIIWVTGMLTNYFLWNKCLS